MERVLSWLNQPLFPDTVIRVWMAGWRRGAALLLALILAFFPDTAEEEKEAG